VTIGYSEQFRQSRRHASCWRSRCALILSAVSSGSVSVEGVVIVDRRQGICRQCEVGTVI